MKSRFTSFLLILYGLKISISVNECFNQLTLFIKVFTCCLGLKQKHGSTIGGGVL